MKYNRQQKYNFWSFVKTAVLIALVCISVMLCYSYLQIRKRNSAMLSNIELQKMQISDLEALSRANKEMVRNLKNSVENQKLALRKISENLTINGKNVEASGLLSKLTADYNELNDRYERESISMKDSREKQELQIRKEKEERATKIEELTNRLNKLKDEIANGRKSAGGSNKSQSEETSVILGKKTSFISKQNLTTVQAKYDIRNDSQETHVIFDKKTSFVSKQNLTTVQARYDIRDDSQKLTDEDSQMRPQEKSNDYINRHVKESAVKKNIPN